MKLISCFIENFGGLSGFSMDFQEGLTVLQAPNGFGKTTLAEFIRAMFYGLGGKQRAQQLRKGRYAPWNGGKYGGHLTFEHEGCRYRIERSFGERDTFNLIDLQTGKKSKDYSKNIGQELFGLDAESFERSTYLPQERQTGAMATDSIRAKLTGLVEDTGDVGNYQKALAALNKKRTYYKHRKGSGGAVWEDGQEITGTQTALDEARGSREQLETVNARIEALTGEKTRLDGDLAAVRSAISAANASAARQTHQRHYAGLEEERRNAALQRELLLERFPGVVPEAEDCAAAASVLDALAALEGRSVATAADAAARVFATENACRFAGGVPTEDALDAARALCGRREQAVMELSGCRLPDEEALQEAERFLAPGIPAEQTLAAHQAALDQARELRRKNQMLAAAPVTQQTRQKRSPAPLALILGLILAAAGIALLSGGNFAPGGVLMGLGMLVLVAAAYLSLRSAARTAPGLSPEVQAMIRVNEEQAAALEADVRQFTALYYPGDPADVLGRIREQTAAYRSLIRAKAEAEEKRRTLKAEIAACDEKLKAFFLGWGMALRGDPRDLLETLRRDCAAWENAGAQLADLDERQQDHDREVSRLRQRLEDFARQYGIVPVSRQEAEDLGRAVWTLRSLDEQIGKLETQMADCRREYGDDLTAPAGEGEDPAVLAEQEQELLNRQDEITQALSDLRADERRHREEAAAIPALEDQLAHWQQKKDDDEKCARLLDDATAFLEQARENLATAYMGPIRSSFAALMGRMMDERREKILVTEELNVYLERCGESRELACFSAGQADLVRLCMRLALVDALFRETKPFVILDDPFVNLDDERMKEALALLRDLGRDRQILYLTCNSSRT